MRVLCLITHKLKTLTDNIQTTNNRNIFYFGIFSWIFLTFSFLKLTDVFISFKSISYLITYNISSVIFLIYLFIILQSDISVKRLIILASIFNVGLILLSYTYDQIIFIHPPDFTFGYHLLNAIINVATLFVSYFIIQLFIKYFRV